MSEGNSCWNGGQPSVSDTLASALWAADTLLNFASLGCAGVNLHGGSSGYYTPIAGSLAEGFVRRPEYFGIELVKQFAGATLLSSTLACPNDRVRAYVANTSGKRLIAVINKSAQPAEIQLPLRHARRQWALAGPAIDSTLDVGLTESHVTALHNRTLHVAPYSAVLVES